MLQPTPDLSLDVIANTLLSALKHNDTPHADAGIEQLYAFTSARMRATTGDLCTFKRVMRNPLYQTLLGHADAQLVASMQLGTSVRQTWRVRSVTNDEGVYVLAFKQQPDNSWLLTGLVREGAD